MGAAGSHGKKHHGSSDSPKHINNYDLWGIHDLLIAGYACPGCKALVSQSNVEQEVRNAALEFAQLLTKVHPIQDCRTAIQTAISSVAPGEEKGEVLIDSVAAVTWSCLDSSATCDSSSWFCSVGDFLNYGATMDKFPAGLEKAPLPPPFAVGKTVACSNKHKQNTHWNRACSYWASLHAMAFRADVIAQETPRVGIQARFSLLKTLAPMIAGGALLCEGCTRHYILVWKDFLASSGSLSEFVKPANAYSWPHGDTSQQAGPPKGIIEIGGSMAPYVPGFKHFRQCHYATKHTDKLITCMADPTACASKPKLSQEASAVRAFQSMMSRVGQEQRLPPLTLSSIFALYHNIVTVSVLNKHAGHGGKMQHYNFPGKSYYGPHKACKSLKKSKVFKHEKDVHGFKCPDSSGEAGLPGSNLFT